MEKIELTRKEWEDLKAYVEFKVLKKKPCLFCPMCAGCLGVEITKNKCEELNDWIKTGDELYSKVSRFIDSLELAPLIRVMRDRILQEENVKYTKKILSHEESRMYRLKGSETSLFKERITIKE